MFFVLIRIITFKRRLQKKTYVVDGSKAFWHYILIIDFNHHQLHLTGLASRVVQHEYDHIEGKLFTDKLSPFKRKILKSKLTQIEKGNIKIDYPMEFAKQ